MDRRDGTSSAENDPQDDPSEVARSGDATPDSVLFEQLEATPPWPSRIVFHVPRRQVIHFIRHGESFANAARSHGASSHYLMEDAMLTPLGEEQARSLMTNPAFKSGMPALVCASPLRRTMQTAVLGFGESGVVLRPDLQETGNMPCDAASTSLGREMLRERGWAGLAQAYAALPHDWQCKGPKWGASAAARFEACLQWIARRPEHIVALVGHHDFLRVGLGGCSLDYCEVLSCTLQAGELRNLEGELIMPELPPRKGSGIFACFAPQPCAHRNRRPRLRPCTAAPDLPAARHPARRPRSTHSPCATAPRVRPCMLSRRGRHGRPCAGGSSARASSTSTGSAAARSRADCPTRPGPRSGSGAWGAHLFPMVLPADGSGLCGGTPLTAGQSRIAYSRSPRGVLVQL